MASRRPFHLLGDPAGWLLMDRNPHSGFSLIELAIVIALIGILASLALPAFSSFIASGRVRTAAEGMLNGLQIARAEAVRRNTFVEFRVGADGIAWDVVAFVPSPPAPLPELLLQTRGAEPNPAVTAVVTSADEFRAPIVTAASTSVITYAGMGRMVAARDSLGNAVPPPPGTVPATIAIRYTSAVSGARALCVAVVANTPRLCDPQLGSGDPRACWHNGNVITGC